MLELETLGRGVNSLLKARTLSKEEKTWQLCRCKVVELGFRVGVLFLRLLLRPGTVGEDLDARLDVGRELLVSFWSSDDFVAVPDLEKSLCFVGSYLIM